MEEIRKKTNNKISQPSNNLLVLLRKGWSIRRLWILSIVGIAGLGLDAAFHTLSTGTPLAIIFDGADFSTGEMVLTTSPEIATLSWTGHITFLTAFTMLGVLPRLFFEKSAPARADGRRWVMLRKGRSIKQMWLIAAIGVAGLALDVSFHWLQDGDPSKVLLNGFEDPNPFIAGLALSAHIMFIGAFALLMFLPKILFAEKDPMTTAVPSSR
ncbi:hypothetical protein NWT39_07815 [Nitrososphaera viennensis]|uniref:Uncharacterized protein n=2 Tax=Nitrososphaera viennensis TaxID=1034015 RepID=A0A060HKQ3_9ARCH|nr:hypothetical protein [Nitrososphaera viennensis]AIC15815.1 membrane protein of unknown function [Nitrososphaera viennensis EN76]UVS67811.1 hypothetical protein NWT39_07815 [Nitrososphaera viennensis]